MVNFISIFCVSYLAKVVASGEGLKSCDADERKWSYALGEDEAADPNSVQLIQKGQRLKSALPGAQQAQAVELASDGEAATPREKDAQGALLQKAASGAESSVELDSAASSHAESADVEGLVNLDHNGNLCMLCSKPLEERVDREYKEFRTDCGAKSSPTGPAKDDLSKPAAQFLQQAAGNEKSGKNGFCELNFAKSCADAIANRDYLYWAKSLNLTDPRLSATASWDGKYCKMNGFLSKDVRALQHDFEGMQAKARQLCETKYSKHDIEKLTFLDMMQHANYDDGGKGPSLLDAERLAAWNCGMGDVGCDMAMCAYSFCEKGDGTVGLYDECEGWHPVHGMPTA
mmetsp:Transcript_156620/g.272549  ORF Transcript_156620/g.272549 Transcript_156620/m.272549 type:complete len:345 (+) Transcript_156620:61-1095(+)